MKSSARSFSESPVLRAKSYAASAGPRTGPVGAATATSATDDIGLLVFGCARVVGIRVGASGGVRRFDAQVVVLRLAHVRLVNGRAPFPFDGDACVIGSKDAGPCHGVCCFDIDTHFDAETCEEDFVAAGKRNGRNPLCSVEGRR